MSRSRSTLLSVLGLLMLAAIGVLVYALLAPRLPRYDVTATGRLQLAPRTLDVLAAAEPGTEIVLATAVRSGQRDPAAVRRVLDVLDEVDRAAANVSVSVIDTASPSGAGQYQRLAERLIERDADAITASAELLAGSFNEFDEAQAVLDALADRLDALRGSVAPDAGEVLAIRASRLRTVAEQIPGLGDAVGAHLDRQIGERPAPDVSAARSLLIESGNALTTVLREAHAAVQPLQGTTDEGTARLARVADQLRSLNETLAAEQAAMQAAPLPSAVRAIAALQASEAMLVLGPAGGDVAAIRVADVLPGAAVGMPTVDPGRQAEMLLANALAGLGDAARPVVVITHASPRRILRTAGDSILASLRRQSLLRGIDWIEWPVAIEPEPPGAIAAALAEGRPTVYVVIGVDDRDAEGRARADRAAAITASLLADGKPVMINLAPSTRPGLGETDPMAESIDRLGLAADTGRPVLGERRRGTERLVGWEHTLVPAGGEHPLAGAVSGLSTLIPWPTIIEADAGAIETRAAKPLITLEDDGSFWREGEWLGYWLTPATQRGLVRNKPGPGGTRDADASGMPIAWAVERETEASGRPARAVVIGSHLWLFDQAADRPAVVEGRTVQTAPGNAALFLSAVEWLAGNDDAVLPGAQAVSTPMVQPIEPIRLSVIRWVLLAGLPAGVLLVGVAVRLVRG